MAKTRKIKFTNPSLKALEPEEQYYRVWDESTPGLFVQVFPSGLVSFRFRYKFAGVSRIVSIGRYGAFTIAQARDAVKYYRGQLAQDIDPREVKAEKKAEAKRDRVIVFRDFIDKQYGPWLRANRKVGAQTETNLKAAWGVLIDRRMDAIKASDLEKWIMEQLDAGSNPVTINRKLDDLRAAYNRAIRWEVVEINPAANLERPKNVKDLRVRYLTDDEEVALYDALDARDRKARTERQTANKWRQERGYEELPEIKFKDFLTPLVRLALSTGARRGELLQLNWNLVNFELKTMTVSAHTAKSARTRHIPLNAAAVDILTRWKAQTGDKGLVFPHPDTGEQMTIIKGSWKKILKDAGIVNFRLHDLRHTFASKLVMRGVDLNTVRELLGHSSLEMTLRYGHLSPDHKAAAVDLL